MIKLINNWVFTLVETVLIVVFAVLLLVFENLFNVLLGVALIVYSLVFVLTKVVSYRGIIQLITIIEFFGITVLAVFVIVNQSIFPEGNIVNSTVGIAMWFRATTEILHSYHGQGQGRVAKRQFNAWKIFAYILLLTVGTFIATNAKANDSLIRYLIAGISVAAAIIMSVLTYTNFRDSRIPMPVQEIEYADDDRLDSAENDTFPSLEAPEKADENSEIQIAPTKSEEPMALPPAKKPKKTKK